VRSNGTYLPASFQAVQSGHIDIQQNKVERSPLQQSYGIRAGSDFFYRVPACGERSANYFPQ
jgi:hypothetical protein